MHKCLDSVVNQTFQDVEIICVNDGSTDSSLTILEEYARKDNRLLILNKENGGLSSARNAGLDIARGEYVGFVDSDDYIDLGTYETAVRHMIDNNVDIVCYGTNVSGDYLSRHNADNEYYRIKFEGKVVLDTEHRLRTDVSSWNKLYRRSVIENYKLRFPVGMYYEDYPFYWQYITIVETAYFDPGKFYHYIRRRGSIMGNTFDRKLTRVTDHLYMADLIFNFWKRNDMIRQNLDVLPDIFDDCFYFAYRFSPASGKSWIAKEAARLVCEMKLHELCPGSSMIKDLYLGKSGKGLMFSWFLFKVRRLFRYMKERGIFFTVKCFFEKCMYKFEINVKQG